jgi:predicted nucleotidyltransferase
VTITEKNEIIHDLVESLSPEREVRRIVVFGSFLRSDEPRDLDVAVFQDSSESYLPLALKYRRCTRRISRRIPMDIVPVRPNAGRSSFLTQIESGRVVYER